jgi:hypothetical protein
MPPTPKNLTEVKFVDPIQVGLQRPGVRETKDQALWVAIRNRTEAINFNEYKKFIDRVLCRGEPADDDEADSSSNEEDRGTRIGSPSVRRRHRDLLTLRPTIHGVDAYNLLRLATEVFLLLQAGVVRKTDGELELLDPQFFDPQKEEDRLGQTLSSDPASLSEFLKRYFGDAGRLPYFDRILENLPVTTEGAPYCEVVLQHRLTSPSLIELIWSYWHEEGMLEQTMKAITLRFQNRRGPSDRDPLANLELDPLRPLNNLLWGYVQDEYRRLTVVRRAYEYDHHYGLTLVGKAVPHLDPADSRSKFIEAFHNLLYRAAIFFREDADTTVIADGFPLLNAIREVHLLLAEGAHNQFGDLPWTARVETLIEQWLLARPEMKEFLRGRYMVPYQEEWMGAVDAMKRLKEWTDVSVAYFHSLAVFGERILLSVRYGDWIDIDSTHEQGKNWARYWRPEIQGYIHAYQAATGVDLAADVTDVRDAAQRYALPSAHLVRRLPAHAPRRLTDARATEELTAYDVTDYQRLSPPPRRRLLVNRNQG